MKTKDIIVGFFPGLLFLAAGTNVQAAVIFNNFDANGGFHPESNLVAADVRYRRRITDTLSLLRAAVGFSVSGGNFNLTSITLPISFQGDFPNNLQISLASDDDGSPGTTLEVLSKNESIWPEFSNPFLTTTTLLSATNPHLIDGKNYWIVAQPTSTPASKKLKADYRWFINTSGSTVPFRQQSAINSQTFPSNPWTGFSGFENPAFRVEGTPVTKPATIPEPTSPLGLLTLGVLGTASSLRCKLKSSKNQKKTVLGIGNRFLSNQ